MRHPRSCSESLQWRGSRWLPKEAGRPNQSAQSLHRPGNTLRCNMVNATEVDNWPARQYGFCGKRAFTKNKRLYNASFVAQHAAARTKCSASVNGVVAACVLIHWLRTMKSFQSPLSNCLCTCSAGCNVSRLSSALTCSQQVVRAVCASVVIERPACGGD